jgi:hypothetical protein
VDVGRLDLRVGHIRSAKKHPDADALYVEEVGITTGTHIYFLYTFISFIFPDCLFFWEDFTVQ